MFCKNCGTKINDGDLFCPNCGLKAGETPVKTNQPSNKYSFDANIILDSVKGYFRNPTGFYTNIKEGNKNAVAVFFFAATTILAGLFKILFKTSYINMFISEISNLGTNMLKKGLISSSEASSYQKSVAGVTIFLKPVLKGIMSNSNIFFTTLLELALLMGATVLILYLINYFMLKTKINLQDILLIGSFSYMPLTVSFLASAIIVRFSFIAAELIILLGFILSLVRIYSSVVKLTNGKETTAYYIVILSCVAAAIIFSIINSIRMDAISENIIKQISSLKDYVSPFLKLM